VTCVEWHDLNFSEVQYGLSPDFAFRALPTQSNQSQLYG
jgi:hypothetical protein